MGFRRFFHRSCLCLLAGLVASAAPGSASAADPVQFVLAGHRFQPDHITVPAGQRFRIELTNHDDTVDEFESYDMKFEKIVVSGGRGLGNRENYTKVLEPLDGKMKQHWVRHVQPSKRASYRTNSRTSTGSICAR